MTDRNYSEYVPGRGIPTYLLSRAYDESSVDSDGASRIFLDTHPTITSAKDTDSSTASNIPYSLSSFSMVSIDQSSERSSNLESNICQNESSSFISPIHDESSDTRTIRGETRSNFNETYSTVASREPVYETSLPSSTSYMDTLYDGPIGLNKIDDYNKNLLYDYNSYFSSVYTDPADMYTPYVPPFTETEEEENFRSHAEKPFCDEMQSDKELKENNSLNNLFLEPPDYNKCCLWGDPRVDVCGPASRHYFDWSSKCVSFVMLSGSDIRSYLKRNNVIRNKEEDDFIMNEKDLIANRLRSKNVLVDDSMFICPKHRSSFGIDWHCVKSKCHHPDHEPGLHSSTSDCRQASLATCLKIEGFPVGGRLCSKHRKAVSMISDGVSLGGITTYTETTEGSEFIVGDSRDSMNRILTQVNLSPIQSQTRKRLDLHSESGLRRLTSKLTSTVRVIQKRMAEALAPGQSEELLEIAHLASNTRDIRELHETLNNEMIQNIKQIYDLYVKQNMPFIEQVRLLSLIPRSWSYEKVIDVFKCSRHAIKTAHRMYDEQEYLLKRDSEPSVRQRADPEKIKHFVSWLVESNTLVSGTYGLTTFCMDNGDKYEVPKQILQLQKTHALINYKKYCDETDLESLGTSKLYDILNSIKPAQQKAVTGLDEFVVEGVEAWRGLSDIVEGLPIPQIDRRRLMKQIDMAETYQKARHSGHCSSDSTCITHCTTFALSDPNCIEQHSKCNHTHTTTCSDCINIIRTLDEIQAKIETIFDKDSQAEANYDFKNASEHIIEWSRHNIRAAQQDSEKTKIISQMEIDEAFCTFDWGQKILPQEYRESQKKYFGKKGMSVFVGSFVWKEGSPSAVIDIAETTNNSSVPVFSTASYILALTNASQTEIDTLSAGEIVLKQFKDDYWHIKKLHKRTDNASNFSSHATPEAEKVICERLGIDLLTRDYSEVQKGKDICDRICGVAKNRMRSWVAAGNNLLNAHDIKEGMEHAGGIKNVKVAVAEIIPGAGYMDKTNIPNISSVRSIKYEGRTMKVFKASSIGTGLSIPYETLNIESNMRVTSPFTVMINNQPPGAIQKRRADRKYFDLSICPVTGCTATFESSIELDVHIAANQHDIPNEHPRTANDIARAHLTDILRSTSMRSSTQTRATIQQQDISSSDLSISAHYKYFSSSGWALRTRKLGNPISKKVKNFLEQLWHDSIKTNTRITPENIQELIRRKKDNNGIKFFQTHEYPTKNQIRYCLRKLNDKYDVTIQQQLIAEIIDDNVQ